MPQEQSSRTYLKRSLPIVISIVVFLSTLVVLYLGDSYYRIKDIQIKDNNKNYPIAGLPIIQGKSMFFISEKDIAETVKKSNAFIKSAEVKKEYPSTVIIRIDLYEPVAYLKASEGYFLLGEEGVILSKQKEQTLKKLPVISYYQNIPFAEYQAGTQLSFKDIRDSLYYYEILKASKLPVIRIDIAGFHMLGLYTEKQVYLFTAEKEREIQVYHLQQAIKQFTQDGKEYKSIDVRFDKPVIRL